MRRLDSAPFERPPTDQLPDDADDFIRDALTRPIEIVHQDEHLIAVFKPAGLMVHRGPMSGPDEPVLLQTLRDQIGAYLYPVHRLDRPTAGLILFGLTSEGAKRLGDLFETRQVRKTYEALVRGWVTESGEIDRPLRSGPEDQATTQEASDGPERAAVTRYRPRRRFETPWPIGEFPTSRFTHLELEPLTGRWHQLRRHLNHLAHPILGDHRHGDHRWNQAFFATTGVYRMLLTAVRLEFPHPFDGRPMRLEVGRGTESDAALAKLEPFAVV
ncbi:MAG TPA: tRNA pseudouridine(65) synthase TruC [Planctomycetaceae bacterium]|nr:tRNA pseudouridine(65) synthase TruC [Planctomycetaceae bacterium]